MSQQKVLTNFDKGKILRDARKNLGLNQRDMADRLNIDPTYLSQLETGARNVDDWYLDEVNRLLEKSNNVKETEALQERPGESDVVLWKRRALAAEKAFSDLKLAVRSLAESANIPTPEPAPKPNSSADERLKDAVEGALADRKKK